MAQTTNLPDGVRMMTPLEMNAQKFAVSHTILTPGLLEAGKSSTSKVTVLKNNS